MLSKFFKRWAENKAEKKRLEKLCKPVDVKQIKFRRFRVTDMEVADRMRLWLDMTAKAMPEFRYFVNYAHTVFAGRAERPHFHLGDDGRLTTTKTIKVDIRQTKSGWGVSAHDFSWMRPVYGVLKKMMEALPQAGSFADLREMIDWPTIDPADFPKWEYHFIQSTNRLPSIHDDGSNIFVDVPEPDYFRDDKRIYALLSGWEKPDFLEDVLPAPKKGLQSGLKP